MLQTCKTFLFHPAPQLLSFYLFILPPYQTILTMISHAEHGKRSSRRERSGFLLPRAHFALAKLVQAEEHNK